MGAETGGVAANGTSLGYSIESSSASASLPPSAGDGSILTRALASASAGGGASSSVDFTFTPLYGTLDDYAGGPTSCLLEVGGVRILLDCGWDIHFDPAMLEPLRNIAPRVDLVLLSHPALEHLGGLPYAFGKLGLNAPVFCTLPTLKMGQMALYNAHQTRSSEEDNFDVFELDDADYAFSRVKLLKYSQHLRFTDRGAGITITPYCAGHMIGGSLWRVSWKSDDNDIVYAIRYNHQRERHLNGSTLEAIISRPSVMITGAQNALTVRKGGAKKRGQELLDVIMATVRKGGNVLLPTDASGRVLELLHLLDDHWTKSRLGTYKCVFLHSMAYNVGEFAKSQLEWMSEDIGKNFDMSRHNPFELKHVHILHYLEELDELGDDPKVVMTSDFSLDYGFSKALLLRWCADSRNTILLSNRSYCKTSIASRLFDAVQNGKGKGDGLAASKIDLTIAVPTRVPLQGEELREHRDAETRKRRAEALKEEQLRQEEEMHEARQAIADDDDDVGRGGGGGAAAAGDRDGGHDGGSRKKRKMNMSLFQKYSKPQHLMFGYLDSHYVMDQYGVNEAKPIEWLEEAMRKHQQKQKKEDEELALDAEVGALVASQGGGGRKGRGRGGAAAVAAGLGGLVGEGIIGDSGELLEEGGWFGDWVVPGRGYQTLPGRSRGRGGGNDDGGDGSGGNSNVGRLTEAAGVATGTDLVMSNGDNLDWPSTADMSEKGGGGGGGGGLVKLSLLRTDSAYFIPPEADDDDDSIIKIVSIEKRVEIAAMVTYIDMEGLADGRSIKNLISNVGPKRLIVIGADAPNVEALAGEVVRAGICSAENVLTPKPLEAVTMALDTDVLEVLMADTLYTTLQWQHLRGHEVAYVECVVTQSSDSTPLLQAKQPTDPHGHPALFLSHGEVKIVDLKTELERAGISAEFTAGVLKCATEEGDVIVKKAKESSGNLLVEGPISDDFFRIRSIVYKQFTVV